MQNAADVKTAKGRMPLFKAFAVVILLWALCWVIANSQLFLLASSMSYIMNYDFGFVRRGLSGEVSAALSSLLFLPGGDIVDIAMRGRWIAVTISLAGFVAVMAAVLSSRPKTERKIVLALAIPLLPGWLVFASGPGGMDTVGFGALAFYCVCLLLKKGSVRWALSLSAAYGIVLAALVFAHEATVLMFALGTVAAIVVFLEERQALTRCVCAGLALLPGIAATAVVAIFGKSDNNLVAQVCARIPHKIVQFPFLENKMEYKEYYYTYALKYYGMGVSGGVDSVAGVGGASLVLSAIFGMLLFVFTLWFIGYISGVGFSGFSKKIFQGKWNTILIALGVALWVPVFAVAYDWVRFSYMIAINVGIVYILYCARSSEIEQALPSGAWKRIIAVFVVLLFLSPLVPAAIVTPAQARENVKMNDVIARNMREAPASCHA